MEGANEYYDLFDGKTEQIGRLLFQAHTHSRGKCFEIFLLPEGVALSGAHSGTEGVVEIYGMTSGQRGWTETYGWKHKGPWIDDVNSVMEEKKQKKMERLENFDRSQSNRKKAEAEKTKALLSSYKRQT